MAQKRLSWEELRREIDAGHPGIHRIIGQPNIDVFVDEGSSRVGIRVPVEPNFTLTEASPLAQVNMSTVSVLGQTYIQVATDARQLYPEFISFINSVAERIPFQVQDPELAIIETLKAWRSLLAPLVILSDEQQIGLWGEIFLLRLMLRASKPINCWTGPLGEPHDFRIGTLEVEVKTTKSQHRLHVINGLDQLSSSIGHKLVLVSLQVAPAGAHAGESLSQLVNSTLQEATKTEGIWKSNSLRELINSIGYREEHSGFYQGPFILRTIPRAVPVDSLFPSITKGRLSQVLGNDVFRIGDVSYRIDVEGLGKEVKPESLIEEIFELV